ncbi:MAG: GspH/FimT family protein [Phycisphaerae bacterium]|nr:GspH/FimT family protein [Phycisphaerae bacterium]MDD5381255.1 GspH/FimT family protein [Phycisphaerae bacterium]
MHLKEDEKRTDVKGDIVRKDKEKKTANLRHRLRRIRHPGGGFTLVEILLVVMIIAIAAMIAVPMIGSMDSVQIRSAANVIAADLEYTKSMAISRQENYSVFFSPGGGYYEIRDADGIILTHPVTKKPYRMTFSSDSRLENVVIDGADFDSSDTITFDYLGSPYSGSGAALNSGTISIAAGDFSMTIRVEPVTGFISIE